MHIDTLKLDRNFSPPDFVSVRDRTVIKMRRELVREPGILVVLRA